MSSVYLQNKSLDMVEMNRKNNQMQLTKIFNHWINRTCILISSINYYSRLFSTEPSQTPPDQVKSKSPASQSSQLNRDKTRTWSFFCLKLFGYPKANFNWVTDVTEAASLISIYHHYIHPHPNFATKTNLKIY